MIGVGIRQFWRVFAVGFGIGFAVFFAAWPYVGEDAGCRKTPPGKAVLALPNLIGCTVRRAHGEDQIECPDGKEGRPDYCMVDGLWVRIDR